MATLRYSLTLVHQEANTRALQSTLQKLESRLRNMGYRVTASRLSEVVMPSPYPESSPAAEDEADAVDEVEVDETEEGVEAVEPDGASAEDDEVGEEEIAFGSPAARELADELGVLDSAFEGHTASGRKGFTVGDVRKVAQG